MLITLVDGGDGTTVLGTTLTDENGEYLFEDLPNGDYLVFESDPDDVTSTIDTDGVPDDNAISVTLSDGEDSLGNDFYDTLLQDVRGSVFLDENGDGVIDPVATRLVLLV